MSGVWSQGPSAGSPASLTWQGIAISRRFDRSKPCRRLRRPRRAIALVSAAAAPHNSRQHLADKASIIGESVSRIRVESGQKIREVDRTTQNSIDARDPTKMMRLVQLQVDDVRI